MTRKEIRSCAADTLALFIQTMPDVPFTEDDIIIEFATKKDMAVRARELCAKYVPDKIINDSQAYELTTSIAANALVGREKSAVIVCDNRSKTEEEWRVIFFHEFMHIYCAKTEMDGEHFIDVYGSGTTLEEIPENQIYDGTINAGYFVWTEFIAHYYAWIKASGTRYDYPLVANYVNKLLCEVSTFTDELSKSSFAMACAYILSCKDVEEILYPPAPEEPDTPDEKRNKDALLSCLRFLYDKLQTERPWKISEGFIETLGGKFIMFKATNSVYLKNAGVFG